MLLRSRHYLSSTARRSTTDGPSLRAPSDRNSNTQICKETFRALPLLLSPFSQTVRSWKPGFEARKRGCELGNRVIFESHTIRNSSYLLVWTTRKHIILIRGNEKHLENMLEQRFFTSNGNHLLLQFTASTRQKSCLTTNIARSVTCWKLFQYSTLELPNAQFYFCLRFNKKSTAQRDGRGVRLLARATTRTHDPDIGSCFVCHQLTERERCFYSGVVSRMHKTCCETGLRGASVSGGCVCVCALGWSDGKRRAAVSVKIVAQSAAGRRKRSRTAPSDANSAPARTSWYSRVELLLSGRRRIVSI